MPTLIPTTSDGRKSRRNEASGEGSPVARAIDAPNIDSSFAESTVPVVAFFTSSRLALATTDRPELFGRLPLFSVAADVAPLAQPVTVIVAMASMASSNCRRVLSVVILPSLPRFSSGRLSALDGYFATASASPLSVYGRISPEVSAFSTRVASSDRPATGAGWSAIKRQ